MSSNQIEQISDEIDRISALPLEEQPAEFAKIRDLLEGELNGQNFQNAQTN